MVVAVTMFSDLNRAGETLIPATAAALRRALPQASLGLADLYICGMNYFPWPVEAVLGALPEVDWALIGEAEPTLPALLDRLEAGTSPAGLPRVAHRSGEGAVEVDQRPPAPQPDLDELPLPAFDLLDMERYFAVQADAIEADLVHEYHLVERQLPLMTSRSCPFRCRFCTNQVLGLPWRPRSVERVRHDVRQLRRRYQVDRLLLLDDNINVDADRFRALVAMFADEAMAWDAVNGFRADRLDREAVRAIKAAGNTKITVSAESGDPELLRKVIRKGLKLGSVVRLAKICRQERVPLQVHYIVGVPGERLEQVNRTLEFATELFEREGAWPLLQHAIPFPGTQMWRDCEEGGWFVAPPESISGAILEEQSIIRTPELDPEAVIAMKRAAQHLHVAIQRLTSLEVTDRCPLQRCLACHCQGVEVEGEPGRGGLRRQLGWARFLGGRELLIGGGEPTLRADLADLVAEARALGYERVRLITSGHGLAQKGRADELVEAGLSGLVVDLHGPSPDEHDAVTGRPDSFRLTVAGLRRAQQAGLTDLEAVAAITTKNLEVLPATVRLADRLGLAGLHLRLPPPDSPAAAAGAIPPWPEALPWLARALAASRPGFTSIQGAPLCLWKARPGALVPLPPWLLRRARPQRARHPVCGRCTMLLLCGGFFRPEHRALYGVDEPPGLTAPEAHP